MEIMGYAAMTFAIDLLEEICQRLAEFDGNIGVSMGERVTISPAVSENGKKKTSYGNQWYL